MEMIKELQINNYKSINQINLSCRRINVLIGKPNVGKSNILEALDLDYLPWLFAKNESLKTTVYAPINLKEYFRVSKVSELFHLGNIAQPISVVHPGFSHDYLLQFDQKETRFQWIYETYGQSVHFNNDFEPAPESGFSSTSIHPYRYKGHIEFHDTGNYFNILMPPYGNNLLQLIENNPAFREFSGDLAKEHGFEFNLDKTSNKLLVQLRVSKGLVYSLPYDVIADTLKRFIFYIGAIRHNRARVLTLEEPEVHSFPPFISAIADEIIKTKDRQFFIATHSPYLLNNLIENTPAGDLAVFVCSYNKEKVETTAKKLSQENLSELLNFGVDIFFNINRYVDDRIENNP